MNTLNLKRKSSKKKKTKASSPQKRTAYSRAACVVALTAVALLTVKNVNGFKKTDEADCSMLEKMLGTNGVSSAGYDHGDIYSIDGQPISEDINGKQCASYGFSSLLGAEDMSGLILNCYDTLHSSASEVNVEKRKGNNIVTTLMYKPQLTATKLLSENFSFSTCSSAEVCVLLRDGAILTAAGLNEYDLSTLDLNYPPKDLCNDYTVTNYKVGSVAKAITARTLLLNNDKLSKEDSLYNDKYIDYSVYEANGFTISNWDYLAPQNYEISLPDGSAMTRKISLIDALRFSSNTYFWRHAMSFGLERAYKEECRLFGIDEPINTEINTIPCVDSDVRLDYYFWGQDMQCSALRLCQLYCHVLSTEATIPFYIASVHHPDDNLIYKAHPKKQSELDFRIDENDILKKGLAECFEYYCENMPESAYSKYSALIADHRLLAKSGTADIDETLGLTNNTRILTVLDENHEVICTACILAERCTPDAGITDYKMFSILFQTLEAAGIL